MEEGEIDWRVVIAGLDSAVNGVREKGGEVLGGDVALLGGVDEGEEALGVEEDVGGEGLPDVFEVEVHLEECVEEVREEGGDVHANKNY